MKKNQFDKEMLFDLYEEQLWIRMIVISSGVVIGIWILGKGSRLLADAFNNFKSLRNAIKG